MELVTVVHSQHIQMALQACSTSFCCAADSLTAHFSSAGKVNMVRICQPNSGPRSVAQTVYGADLAVSRQLHALVEYSSQEEAAAAVKQLTDSNNWYADFTVVCTHSEHVKVRLQAVGCRK